MKRKIKRRVVMSWFIVIITLGIVLWIVCEALRR
jgi:hypothetical protein